MDRGSHNHECATAVSGTCHCDCHGAQHGVVHLPKGATPKFSIAKLAGGGVEVRDQRTGFPPGGGTKEERLAIRAAGVKVVDGKSSTPASAAKPLLPAAELDRLDQRARDLTGSTRRGGRSPNTIGQEFAKAVRDGDAQAADKLAGELHHALYAHRASPRTVAMWRKFTDPVAVQAKASRGPTVLSSGPRKTAAELLVQRVNAPAHDDDLFVRAARHADKGQFDALPAADRKAALDKLERLGRGIGSTAADARVEHNRLSGGPVPKPAGPTVPPHVLAAQQAVGGNRSTGLPLSMLYAQVSKQQYEQHFTKDQRSKILAKMTEIRGNMRADAPDRPGVDRVVKDLETIDGNPSSTTKAERVAARSAEVKVTASTTSTTSTTPAGRIAAKEAELATARQALASLDPTPGTSRLRGKQHGQRIDANVRRAVVLSDNVRQLESELEGLRRQAANPSTAPLDLSKLPAAKLIRTKYGWYEVAKVNKSSVKVKAAPGMDDLIPIKKIVEIR